MNSKRDRIKVEIRMSSIELQQYITNLQLAIKQKDELIEILRAGLRSINT